MSAAPHPSVATLFGELLELPSTERAERLDALQRSAPALAREVAALLEADREAGDFLGLLHSTAERATWPATGTRVGPYVVVRPLGEGGMGAVWLARDARLDRLVALKFLHDDVATPGSRGGRERLLAEARAAAALDHPHIVAIHDVGETDGGRVYLAMAYCEGGSLAERLATGPLAPTEAARLGAEVAAALDAAHARGLVHRDVKPANVLFDAAGLVRLADFGVARTYADGDAASARTVTGMVVGTMAYLAPERLHGARATPQSDLWALGVTLYEALVGRRPFAGETSVALLHAILTAEPAPLPATVPPPLAAVVTALLAKDPDRRPASARQVAAALRAVAFPGPAPGVELDAGLASDPGRYPAVPLPTPLSSFVGRARELAEVTRQLGETRLLTLTGAGGSGKTRLALEIARTAAAAASGSEYRVTWVELAPVAEPEQVAGQIAAALGVTERPGTTPLEAVRAVLGAAPRLLVLDNCEHLVDACSAVADALLRGCPELTILATSREPLGISGEVACPVPALSAADARRLFAERARARGAPHEALAAAPGAPGALAASHAALPAESHETVDEICRRLDGLPLAIELAAARARALAPAQIAERLDDVFRLLSVGHRTALPRHRTLRATMDWSHALLAERERVLFRRLAVFAADFPLEAVEAVCAAAPLPADAVLDTLEALVDKSLVRAEPGAGAVRYRLLETVRQYARERLEEAGELDVLEAAHVMHYLAVAEAAAPHIQGGMRGADVLARLATDQHDLRAASLRAVRAAGDDPATWADVALRFADALFWYWYGAGRWIGRGQFTEGWEYAEAALRVGAGGHPLRRARAHLTAAMYAFSTGRLASAAAHAADTLELARTVGVPLLAAFAQASLGRARLMLGDVDEAVALLEAAVATASSAAPAPERTVVQSFSTGFLAMARVQRGELATARTLMERLCAAIPPEVDPAPSANARSLLGHVETLSGNLQAAAGLLHEALAQHLAVGDVHFAALDLGWLAGLAAARGRHDAFARFAGAEDALHERVGTARWPTEAERHARAAAAARAALREGYEAHHAAGRALSDAELLRLAEELA